MEPTPSVTHSAARGVVPRGLATSRGRLLLAGVAALLVILAWMTFRTRPASSVAGTTGAAGPPHQLLTAWDKDWEVAIDLPPLVAGRATHLHLHLTELATGEPRSPRELSLRSTHQGQQQTLAAVPRPSPGILVVEFTPASPGKFAWEVAFDAAAGPVAIAMPPVEAYATAAEADEALGPSRSAGASRALVKVLKEQQWRLKLITEPTGRHTLVERLIAPGTVIAPPGASAVVTPPVAGTLAPPPEGNFPRVGELVERDQWVATLEPSLAGTLGVQILANQAQLESLDAELAVREMQMQTALKVAESELVFAQRLLDRLEKLAPSGVTTARQLDDARLAVMLAEKRVEGARSAVQPYAEARQRLSQQVHRADSKDTMGSDRTDLRVGLRSPIRGTVVEISTTAGQFFGVGERIMRIVNLDRLWIEARVSEYDLGRVEAAPGASYALSSHPDELTPILGEGGGRLVDVGSLVDENNRTVPVRYEVPNLQGRLRVGMFAEVQIETKRRQDMLAVPVEAIIDEAGETTVFVQIDGESFESRHVKLGIRDSGLVEVQAGLEPGERVVTRGAYAVRLVSMSAAMPEEGHEH